MEKYLRKCLDSLVIESEGMKQLEVLVINDGSKDTSSQIAQEYQNKYPDTFRVIDKENGNYGSCINRGLREATGKYVKILDADDSFVKENIISLINCMLEFDVDMFLTNYYRVDEDGNITNKTARKFKKSTVLSIDEYLDKDFKFEMHEIAYKTCILKKNGYRQTEGVSYTDVEWATIPFAWINTFVNLDLFIYKYLVGREGQTVGMKSFLKNSHHSFIGIFSEVQFYLDWKDKLPINRINYLRQRIIERLTINYKKYLYVGFQLDLKTLLEWDNKLKETAFDLWEELDDKAIARWRKNPSEYTISRFARNIQLVRNLLSSWFSN